MATMAELAEIYAKYETKLAKAIDSASAFAGAFNMGDDPRKHPCNEAFYEGVEEWAEAFLAARPSPAEAAEAARWILEYPAQHRNGPTWWYTFAAQKHASGMVGLLTQEAARKLLADCREWYPKEVRLPVQEELLKKLAAQAGEKQTAGNSWLKTWGVRVVLLLVGLTIAHLGVTLFLLADLGSDPFNVMIQGLHRMTEGMEALSLTHGTVHMAISFLIIAALLVIDRSYVRIGTFLCMILGGPIIDVFTLLLQSIINSGSPMIGRIIAVVLGCGILAFGMTIVIKSQAGTGPNDLVAVVISDKGKWKFGLIRILVDGCFALTGFLLGGTVGIGTIICMAVVGPVAQIFMPFSEKLCGKFLNT